MPSSETVTLAGSGLVFNNTYSATVTDAYRNAAVTAEHQLQALFSNAVTLNVNFDYQHLGDGVAENRFFVYQVSYGQLVAALTAHATTPDDMLAVAGLPLTDPSGVSGWAITGGEGQALGILTPSGDNDLRITLNSDEPWFFGQDAVSALEHEITEGGFGRVQSLAVTGNHFMPFDLFRFTTSGARDYTGGSDGQFTVFGVDPGHLTSVFFHNALSLGGTQPDGGDLADWDFPFDDSFGFGGGGLPNTLSVADLRVLDVLGWTPTGAALPALPDDFASSFADTGHPLGQLAINTPFHGVIDSYGDRDWLKVQLAASTDYLVTLTGITGGGGTLDDPTLVLHDAAGVQIADNDDIGYPANPDSQLIVHSGAGGAFYVEAESFDDETGGSYTVTVQTVAAASTPGGDVMVGQVGGSTIMAGGGADTIVGDNGQNYLRGEDGDDVITGGAAFDDINGNMGNDTVHGGTGDDWTVGGKDSDMLFGDAGDDIVWGNLGNDTLSGGSGADQVRGGQGDDVLNGGSGNDYVSGDRGNDTITGGLGADRFHGSQDAGIDRVLDFFYSEGDRVQLDPGTTFTASQVGADTVLDMGGGNQMILVGVTLANLPADWFFLG